MYCQNCGKGIDHNANYCQFCGYALNATQDSHENMVDDNASVAAHPSDTEKSGDWIDFAKLCAIFFLVVFIYGFCFSLASKDLTLELLNNIPTTAFLLGLGCYLSFRWHRRELSKTIHFFVFATFVPLNTFGYFLFGRLHLPWYWGIGSLMYTLLLSMFAYYLAGRFAK